MYFIHQIAGLEMNLLKNERVGKICLIFGTSRVPQFSVSTERKIPLSNLFNNLQKERGELTPLSHFYPFHGKLCNINPAQYKYPIPVW